MKNNKHQQQSDEELNQQINDKLNQLWSQMNVKRKKLVRNMTPSYSRRTDNISEINQSSTNFISENQILKIRDKLTHEISLSKQKDIQIENLKTMVAQLTNDKKMLVFQLQQAFGHQENINSSLLNESSISNSKLDAYKNTANFQNKKTKKNNCKYSTINEQPEIYVQSDFKKELTAKQGKLQDLSKNRLVELLRSTAQYRQFVYYYDSHQLSYLRRLQEQHRHNCDHKVSHKQKTQWAPAQILNQFHKINTSQKLGLTQAQIHLLISSMKGYYETNFEARILKNKQDHEAKLKKLQREARYGIPYDLVQVCRAKERQLTKMSCGSKKNRTNSFK